ncbi:hypothetical protein GOBAR_AA24728 [Gossypium barbadense]|uniref:Uncharacterized protein n=1 Tax=Gossypium barbadense TaxID=3634 RepID=A0A2P5WXW8_GOSBA|nr:hypothetical protein GOBAR_AA24728 [Gossypium barbadense]
MNVFQYCLEGYSPNGWRHSDNMEVAQSLGVLLEGYTWLDGLFDELGIILWGSTGEPINFFYCFYEMKLRLFAFAKYSQREGGRQNVNLLTAPTNHRVVADAGINHSFGDSSSETNSISCKTNEAMDIDSFISGARMRRKTTMGVVRISSTSEEEESRA